MTREEISILGREVFTERDAAQLLGVTRSVLHGWLEGVIRGSKAFAPVLRVQPTGSRWVVWAEFVEAAWLSTYRGGKDLPLAELRRFRGLLREQLDVAHPLAHLEPFVGGRQRLFQIQEEAGLLPDFQLVLKMSNQYLLTSPGRTFHQRVVWDGDVAVGWRPHDVVSPVIISPDVQFGRPAIKGISTSSIVARAGGGASRKEIADEFSLQVADVRWAAAYEAQRHLE
jgi:uncharacterized protein (DUF433 family)